MDKLEFSEFEQSQLRNLGVQAVMLFGSQAQGVVTPDSDYDIGVLTSPSADRKSVYDDLYDLLTAKIYRLVDIDIVFLDTAPMELQSHVAKHGVPLYQAHPNTFANYKEKVMNIYADFAPIRQMFSNATISRISP